MREVARGAVIRFLLDPSSERLDRLEDFADEISTYFSSIGTPDDMDDELQEAFDSCLEGCAASGADGELFGLFAQRYLDLSVFAPSDEVIRSVLDGKTTISHDRDEDDDVPPEKKPN